MFALLVSSLLVLGVALPAQAGSGQPAPAPLPCGQLVGQSVSVQGGSAQVTTATTVAAAGTASGSCEVAGAIGGIHFTLRLPSDWNGRYFQTGCGGF
ncbi:MAG: hypothetical protein ABIW80_14695, partial [Lapillicoccus sp.]